MKFALVSAILPPSESAQAIVLHRLLRDVESSTYCLLSTKDYGTAQPSYYGKLPGKYYYLPPTFRFERGYRFGLEAARERLNLYISVIQRAKHILDIVLAEKCEAVVACTGGRDVSDFPATYLASRWGGLRFYAYLLDQYSHMVSYRLGKSMLRHLEPIMMKGAAAVITHNEFLGRDLRHDFGVEPAIIHNPCDLAAYESPAAPHVFGAAGRINIVYTGSMTDLQFGATRNLIVAIESQPAFDIKLQVYTAHAPATLQEAKIVGPVEYHAHESLSAIPAIQKAADVLFLPLTFAAEHKEITRTAAPGKMGELLAARRPILVHAPADSFIAWYFRHHDCGLVVDRDSPQDVAKALRQLLQDRQLVERLTANAWTRAVEDFSVTKARMQFERVVAGVSRC